MVELSNILFLPYFILFLGAVFIAFYIPGTLLLKRIKLTTFQRSLLGIVVGMVMWGWQGFVFGYLHMRWLSYVYLVIAFILWCLGEIKNKEKVKISLKFKKIDGLLAGLIILGTVVQLASIAMIGIATKQGLLFCCGNTSDNLFHIALTNQLVNQFPPYEPGMYGVIVHNYHYWSNLVVAELIRVFKLPLIWTQYQYFSLLISSFLGLLAIVFAQLVNLSKKFAAWLVFFLYFGGDFIYLLFLLLGKGLSFKMSALENGSSFLENPPRAFSIVVFLCGLSLFTLWIKKKDIKTGLIMALVFGTLIGFKVYTGLFLLSGLAVVSLYYLFLKKYALLIPILITFLLSAIIYLPVNVGSGGLYYTGFWRFENFIVSPELGLTNIALALQIYKDHSNSVRIFEYESILFLIYSLSILGTKLLGFFQTKKSLALFPRELNIFLMTGIVVSSIGGLFFQQTSGGSNTFNFLVSVFIIGSLYTALACYYISEKINNKFRYVFIVLVVLLTIPRVIYSVVGNGKLIKEGKGFVISNEEMKGYKFLNPTVQGTTILVYDARFSKGVDSPYMSFMTNNNMYLSGNGILESHGVSIKNRRKVEDLVFDYPNEKVVAKSLLNAKIDYVVMRPQEDLVATKSAYFMNTIFQNNEIKILKVSRSAALKELKVLPRVHPSIK